MEWEHSRAHAAILSKKGIHRDVHWVCMGSSASKSGSRPSSSLTASLLHFEKSEIDIFLFLVKSLKTFQNVTFKFHSNEEILCKCLKTFRKDVKRWKNSDYLQYPSKLWFIRSSSVLYNFCRRRKIRVLPFQKETRK